MAASFEAYVIDNDMLGSILKSLSVIEVSPDTLALDNIAQVVASDGHFLGQPATLARMSSDFVYPQVADRRSPAEWADAGSKDIRSAAKQRARDLLASHFPAHMSADVQAAVREHFDIRLPEEAMRAE
jgi:trimethylamine--corrinoid protein Co-methyltransferase